MSDDTQTEQRLADWNARLSTALGVPPADIDAILGLAGVVAHGVVRPAAPLSTFLVGYAAGLMVERGLTPDEALSRASAVAEELATQEPSAQEAGAQEPGA
jgi:hypothetical protein